MISIDVLTTWNFWDHFTAPKTVILREHIGQWIEICKSSFRLLGNQKKARSLTLCRVPSSILPDDKRNTTYIVSVANTL